MSNREINEGTVVAACVVDLVCAIMRKIDASGLEAKLAGSTANENLQNSLVAAKVQTQVRKSIGGI